MYNQGAQSTGMIDNAITSAPELANIHDQFAKANSEYLEILYNVEDKLHNILNLRGPEKSSVPNDAKEKVLNDFSGAMNESLLTYRTLNSRLQKVLEHIRKIVG